MPTFRYNAINASGESIIGETDADNEALAFNYVQSLGLLPIEAKVANAAPWWSLDVKDIVRGVVSTQSLCLFTRQLARLLKAGMDIDRALQLLGEMAELGKWRQTLHRALEQIRQGKSFADALSEEKKAFSTEYVSMVRVGEMSGSLISALERLASLRQRRESLKQRILSALIYPALLLIMALGSIIVILTMVLPQFEPLFVEARAELPLPTRIVLASSNLIQNYWWLAMAGLAGAIGFARHVKRSGELSVRRDKLLLKAPIFGSLQLRADISRFARTLGTLMSNGVTIETAIPVAQESLSNRYLRREIEMCALSLREGEGLSGPLAKSGCFPHLFLKLLMVGEETGRLEEMLIETADIYEEELQRAIDRMLTLLVPALTVIMGGIVAFVVSALLLAMLSVNDFAV
ncbi:MAG: type II secretion system F family protein [Alphaproteobacteria bacterium]|nr:type II secretion system F family protein [Alphaproteobacteria bacterium]